MATVNISIPQQQCLAITGDLSFATAPSAVKLVKQSLASPGEWTIDLTDITHADSAGMAFVCEIERFAKQNNMSLNWVNIPEQMRNIAQVSGLEPLFEKDSGA